MSLVVTQEGAAQLWFQILSISSIGYPWVHLFNTRLTPQHTDTYSTYSEHEIAITGYAPIQLTSPGANWTTSFIPAGAQTQHNTLSWLFTGGGTVDGFWLSDASNTYSLWAELFAVEYTYPLTGGTFQLTLPPWLASCPVAGGIPVC